MIYQKCYNCFSFKNIAWSLRCDLYRCLIRSVSLFTLNGYILRYCILVLVFCSCNNNDRISNEVRDLYGRKIAFPDGYVSLSYHDSVSVDSLLTKDVKLVSYIDNLPCTSCGVKMLHAWIEEVKEIDPEVAYVIVVQTQEKNVLFENIDSMRLPCPLMYYDTSVFGEANKLDILARNKTFLLNKENKIVLVGEPFGNEKLTQLYKKTIASLKEEYAHVKNNHKVMERENRKANENY